MGVVRSGWPYSRPSPGTDVSTTVPVGTGQAAPWRGSPSGCSGPVYGSGVGMVSSGTSGPVRGRASRCLRAPSEGRKSASSTFERHVDVAKVEILSNWSITVRRPWSRQCRAAIIMSPGTVEFSSQPSATYSERRRRNDVVRMPKREDESNFFKTSSSLPRVLSANGSLDEALPLSVASLSFAESGTVGVAK